jgi:hypothetical protein
VRRMQEAGQGGRDGDLTQFNRPSLENTGKYFSRNETMLTKLKADAMIKR